MKRLLPLVLAAPLVLPAAAPAKIAEVGVMAPGVKGSCPENCQAVSRTTGYQAKVGPTRALYQAQEHGRIVAWSISLGDPGPKQTAFFNERLGGTSKAAVVVLRPGSRLRHRVVAKAPLKSLAGYFGTSVQFPLTRTLRVRKGDYIGLTVPTWAPALQIGLGGDTSWRSSRGSDGCSDTSTQSALLGSERTGSFRCLYRTARLTYSATMITDAKRGG